MTDSAVEYTAKDSRKFRSILTKIGIGSKITACNYSGRNLG